MKLFFLLVIFFTSAEFADAQTTAIDSLDGLIKNAPSDTARINLLIKKLNLLGRINLDSSISLGEKTFKEAKAIKYYDGEIKTLLNLSKNYCFKGDYKIAAANLKYLEQFIKPSKDSTDFADVYATRGMMYGMQTRYDSAVYFYEKSIRINERNGNKKSLALNYSNIAISYQQQSDFSQALFYQQKALKIAEEQDDEISMAYTYTNLGNTYDYIDDTIRAEQAYLKAADLAKKKDLINVELYVYSNLSTLYMNQKNWKRTYDFAIKAANLAETTGDHGSQSGGLANAAEALANTNEFSRALEIAKKSILLADSSEQPLKIFQAYLTLGNVFKLQGNCKEAIVNYEKSMLSLKDADIYNTSNGELYKNLSECYEQTGNYNKALQLYKTYAQVKDSAKSKDNVQKTTELTLNYEFEKKQQTANAEQQKKDALANTKQTALIIGLVLTFILALVALNGFRNKRKSNFLLRKQKAKIQSTLNELTTTQAQLIQSEKMASLGELTAGIAHEIQNPLNFVNNFSEVSNELIEELEAERSKVKGERNEEAENEIINDIKQNLDKINHHGRRADAIVKGMLLHSRKSTGQKEPTDINSLCDEYLRLSYHGLRAKDKAFNAHMNTSFDRTIGKINVIPQDIGRVMLNILTNAFYALNEKQKSLGESFKAEISVQTKKLNSSAGTGGAEIIVSDNGSGIPSNITEKIFQPFFTTKPSGQGTGLGLSLAYDIIIKQHNGSIKVESKEGEGTTFIIQIPNA